MSPSRAIRVPVHWLFIAIVLLGSFLLFLIQPLFARLVLPVLGGSPSVWNTAMLFYQAALLLGYAYAHALARLPFRTQATVHILVFAAAALTLPVGIRAIGGAETGDAAPFWLLQLLALSIGPVFVAVSAQAPLMQAWFARSSDARAASPWFLYAASNVGSLCGLLAYPFLIEPFSSLPVQQFWWSAGFIALFALMALGAWAIWRGGVRPAATVVDHAPRNARPITYGRRLRWVLLAAVPSGLMLSTTTHITTDIMAMPMLWAIPLATYLISFIIVFSRRGPIATRGAALAAAPALLLFGGAGFLVSAGLAVLYGFGSILLLLLVAIALHGALAADRPSAAKLTEFYLWMSVGGVIGGLFPALIAPRLFDWSYEHPILLLMAALLLPAKPLTKGIGALWRGNGLKSRALRILTPPLTLALSWWLGASFMGVDTPPEQEAALLFMAGIAIFAIGQPVIFTWHLAMLMLALGGWQQIDISTIPDARHRSFFGIYTVENSRSENVRRLLHGTTLHGSQSLNPALSREPLTYYAPDSGVGLALRAAPSLFGGDARIGVVGLGTGSLACYATPTEDWTMFEIDPLVVKLATDPRIFSFIDQCKPDIRIVIGDARLKLAAEPAGRFDMLAVDAFSSDAIPLHLLTREAFQTYFNTLSPDGVLLVHISNRYLHLEPVVGAIARDLGISARILHYDPDPDDLAAGLRYNRSMWMALTRDEASMVRFTEATGRSIDWMPADIDPKVSGWTDGFASVLPVFRRL
ncbi:MAG: fused MFS/spermidine synthase [Sphingomonadaceae bacterium]